ncbi:hypothetical protein NDU88_004661, partial [Pleurodeles waltl]
QTLGSGKHPRFSSLHNGVQNQALELLHWSHLVVLTVLVTIHVSCHLLSSCGSQQPKAAG